uniref:Peptidase S1 domain-containing protein n=1 Tax=Anopheles arabiensis TaxID=7173 RepID=A0A182I0Y6_ANOAR
MQLRLGRFNLMNNEEEYAEEFSVNDTIVHEGYRPTTLENDIAILRVEIPIIFNDYIQPVCLWKRDDGFDLPNVYNQPGTVVGWGLSENNRIGTTLNEAQMPVVNSWTCLASDRAFFGRFLQSKAFCAGYKNGELFYDAYIDWVYENTPTSGNDDPILGHPNMRLINQGNCGRNEHMPEMDEDRKPILNQYPWMVVLQAKTTTEYVPCNGVLLNRNYVLTAECYDLQYEITATLGDYDTSRTKDCGKVYGNMQCLSAVQTVSVSQFIRKDDLVLVRLSDPADIGRRQNIEAICLPVTPEQRIRLYNRYIMTGWKESGSDATILQRALLEAIGLNKCRAKFKGRIDSKTICVWNLEDPNRSVACNDYTPGSALQAIDQKSKRYLLYGVLRYISYCSVPEQYIAISEYLLWILDNIRR